MPVPTSLWTGASLGGTTVLMVNCTYHSILEWLGRAIGFRFVVFTRVLHPYVQLIALNYTKATGRQEPKLPNRLAEKCNALPFSRNTRR
jgi:hypothetical protein